MPTLRHGYHTQDIARMHRAEQRLLKELERTDVRHVDLREYAVGSDHYEQLWLAMQKIHNAYWLCGCAEHI